MKKYLSILSAVLCLGLYSCEDQATVGVEYGPSVLISNYGLQSINILDVTDLAQKSSVYVECDGAYDGEVNVKLVLDEAVLHAYNEANGTSYRLLPADYYSLDAASKKMTDKQAEFVLTYDVEKICALANVYDYSDIRDYVIPFAIVSETSGLEADTLDGVNNILVNPRMFHYMDNFHLVPPTSDGIKVTESSYILEYKLVTVENNEWASDYEFNLEVKNDDGRVWEAGAEYELVCSSVDEAFVSGVSEIVYTLTLPKSAFTANSKCSLTAELKEVEGGFFLEGEGVSTLTFEAYGALSKEDNAVPGFERTRPYGDVCGNWLNNSNNPYMLINGKYQGGSEYWGWNWNKRAEGGVRPEDAPYANGAGHPYVFTFDLSSTVEIAQVDLWRSNTNEGNWKSLGAGYVEFSTDRTNWTDKVEFDFTDPAKYPYTNQNEGLGPLEVPNAAPVSCKYIRVTLTRNWYCEQKAIGNNDGMGLSAAFAELDVYIVKPVLY